MRRTLLPLVLCLAAAAGTPHTARAAQDGPGGMQGRFGLRATVGAASVSQSGFDQSAMVSASGIFAATDFLGVTAGLRYFPEFRAGSGRSKGSVEVLMGHLGAELGVAFGPVTPFLRPELNVWDVSAEYQGRSLDGDTGASAAAYAGIRLRVTQQFNFILEAGRSFDVSGTNLDSLGVGIGVRF